jgi:hypothetical protein
MADDARSPVERILADDDPAGPAPGAPRLSRASMQARRTLEGYLKAGNQPRWMQRIGDIDRGVAAHRRRLERAHRALREECGGDDARFARRWRETAERWSFDDVNELVAQHNEYFPIERQLPIDLRTRDYVLINGRSYRRTPLDAAWVLEQLPAAAA